MKQAIRAECGAAEVNHAPSQTEGRIVLIGMKDALQDQLIVNLQTHIVSNQVKKSHYQVATAIVIAIGAQAQWVVIKKAEV